MEFDLQNPSWTRETSGACTSEMSMASAQEMSVCLGFHQGLSRCTVAGGSIFGLSPSFFGTLVLSPKRCHFPY